MRYGLFFTDAIDDSVLLNSWKNILFILSNVFCSSVSNGCIACSANIQFVVLFTNFMSLGKMHQPVLIMPKFRLATPNTASTMFVLD